MASGPAARGLTKNVVKGGLLVNPRVSGTLWVGMLPLIGLGIAYLVAGIQNQEPGGGNVAILLSLAVGARRS